MYLNKSHCVQYSEVSIGLKLQQEFVVLFCFMIIAGHFLSSSLPEVFTLVVVEETVFVI